ncbi:MAG: 2-amino-4-hydroxy-6-hydroxymethyldihydropteridine diphosphokinase [Desulfopila sp.]
MNEDNRVFVGLGSNLGNSPQILLAAWTMLAREGDIRTVALSSPYRTAPVDMQSQHWFTNAVGELRTRLEPRTLLTRLLAVEASLGRVRDGLALGYQDRTIDLDLLYYGEQRWDEPELVLPHPRIEDRLFVLAPLAEIAADFRDCRRGVTVGELHGQLQVRIVRGSGGGQEISRTSWPV